MGLIKEPLDVDFYVTGQEMTIEDQKRVSYHIKQQKDKKKAAGSIIKNKPKQNA
jgi:hypothetical protein